MFNNKYNYAWTAIAAETNTADELIARLSARGITHLLVNRYGTPLPTTGCDNDHCPITFMLNKKLEGLLPRLRFVAQSDDAILYAIK